MALIEVTHATHRRDRQKADEYAAAGVPEYWMIDLVAGEIVVHRSPGGGSYGDVTRMGDGHLALPAGGPPLEALLAAAGRAAASSLQAASASICLRYPWRSATSAGGVVVVGP